MFDFLLYPAKSKARQQHYLKCQERLLRLFANDAEPHSDSLPGNVHSWSQKEFPGYKKNDVYFLKSGASSQRCQKSGLCYMHAPAMVQHCAVSKVVHPKPAPMLDLVKQIRNDFTSKQLEEHIFHNEGGDSASFLQSILIPGSEVLGAGIDQVPQYFANYGPALVSRFQVHPDFLETKVHHHNGAPTGSSVGMHAMMLAGHRLDAGGKLVLLLQNWWADKQFVEIDEEYFRKCFGLLHFVTTPQPFIPSSFSFDYARFHECELIDKAEGHCHEWIYGT